MVFDVYEKSVILWKNREYTTTKNSYKNSFENIIYYVGRLYVASRLFTESETVVEI